MSDNFIPQKGYYRKLRVYQIAEIIYDEIGRAHV